MPAQRGLFYVKNLFSIFFQSFLDFCVFFEK